MNIFKLMSGEVRRAFVIDLFSGILSGLYSGMAFTFAGIEARRLGAPSGWVAAIESAGPLGSLISLFAATKLLSYDAVRTHARIVGFGRGLLIVLPLTGYFLPEGRILAGIFFASIVITSISSPSYLCVMQRVYPDHLRSQIMAYVRVGAAFSGIIGAYGGGLLLEYMNVHLYYGLTAIPGIISCIIFQRISGGKRIVASKQNHEIFSLKPYLEILRTNSVYRTFMMYTFIAGSGNLLICAMAPVFWKDVLGMTSAQLGRLQSISFAISLVTFIFFSRIIDRARPIWMHSLLQGTLCLRILSYLISAIYATSKPMFLAFVLTGFANAAFDLSHIRILVLHSTPQTLALYQAIWAFGFGIRGLLMPAIAVWLVRLAGGTSAPYAYIFLFSTGLFLTFTGSLLNYLQANKIKKLESDLMATRAKEISKLPSIVVCEKQPCK